MGRKILVLGATGTVGRHLVSGLVQRGERVKAASRMPRRFVGAESVVFDYTRPETFDDAFADVDRAYILVPSGNLNANAAELLVPVVQFAASKGVKVVLQSVLGPADDDFMPYKQVERELIGAGTPYVILRPNWFADNFHRIWKEGVDRGSLAIAAGHGATSFIDARDIADAAASVLLTDRFDGGAFSLTGPSALTYADAADALTRVTGHTVRYTPLLQATFIDSIVKMQMSEAFAVLLSSIFHSVREGWAERVTDDVEHLTGHRPRSLQTYVEDNKPRLL